MKPAAHKTHPSEVLTRLGLPDPLSSRLITPASGSSADAIWRRVELRLERSQPAKSRRWSWALALGVAALSAVAVLVLLQRVFTSQRTEQIPPPVPIVQTAQPAVDAQEGPLLLQGGRSFESVSVAFGAAPEVVKFEDGSSVTLASSTKLEALAMTGREVLLRLVAGKVEVSVVPGGPRKWVVEAGALSVEVVGTRFSVERTQSQVRVSVDRGAVLLRSAMLDDGVKRIAAGGELTLSNEPTNETRDVAPAPAPSPRSARTSPHATPGMLLAQADSARLAGDLKAARRALQTLLSQYPSDPRLDLARFQLAVIKEQEGANPRQVVDAFERACARVQGSSLRQDCYFRWYQAEVRAGMTLAARQTAERALREFPEGRYSSRLRRQLAGQDSAP